MMAPQEDVEKFECYGMCFIYLFIYLFVVSSSPGVDRSAQVSLS